MADLNFTLRGRFPDVPPLPPWLSSPDPEPEGEFIDPDVLVPTETGIRFVEWTLVDVVIAPEELVELGANIGRYLTAWAMGFQTLAETAGINAADSVSRAWELQQLGLLTLRPSGIVTSAAVPVVLGDERLGPGFTSLDHLTEIFEERHG